MPRRRRQKGLTLLEILVVMGVLVLMMGVGINFLGQSKSTQLRIQTNRLAAAIRHAFNRSVTHGLYLRMTIDLEADAYWVDASAQPVFLKKEKRNEGDEDERKKDGQQADSVDTEKEAAGKGEKARSRRSAYAEDGVIPKITMEKGIGISGVMTSGQEDEFTSGKAFIHFFPNGWVEPSMIYTTDGEETTYTLFVNPLTGKVSRKLGKIEADREFGEAEDVEDEGR